MKRNRALSRHDASLRLTTLPSQTPALVFARLFSQSELRAPKVRQIHSTWVDICKPYLRMAPFVRRRSPASREVPHPTFHQLRSNFTVFLHAPYQLEIRSSHKHVIIAQSAPIKSVREGNVYLLHFPHVSWTHIEIGARRTHASGFGTSWLE